MPTNFNYVRYALAGFKLQEWEQVGYEENGKPKFVLVDHPIVVVLAHKDIEVSDDKKLCIMSYVKEQFANGTKVIWQPEVAPYISITAMEARPVDFEDGTRLLTSSGNGFSLGIVDVKQTNWEHLDLSRFK